MNKYALSCILALGLMVTFLLPEAGAATEETNKEAGTEASLPAAKAPEASVPEIREPGEDAPTPEPVADKPQESHELWSGSLYTSSYRAGVCIDPVSGKVRGVLLLRTMGGQVDPYHFWGSMENGVIRASHTSGHNFKGRFTSGAEVSGTIKLKSGRNIELTGTRTQNASLTDTCRPLPD